VIRLSCSVAPWPGQLNRYACSYMSSLVSELEHELLPRFTDWANRLRAECPNVRANVFSHSVGSLTEYQGHGLGIDCLLTDTPDERPDNVALVVDVQHLTTVPLIDADVCWGHPSGHVEAEFSFDPQDASSEVLKNLYADLPRLYDALVAAAKRGKPSDCDAQHA
jgi:hypothetical protein